MSSGAPETSAPPPARKGVRRDELAKVPYVQHVPADGRSVFLAPYFDKSDEKWRLHLPRDDELIPAFGEPVEACYYAQSVQDASRDVYLEFVDVIARHYSFGPVMNATWQLVRRILDCAVVVEKYFLWLALFRKTKNLSIANLVQTDLEFIFGNVRIAYDLMQTIIRELWAKTGRPELRDSFADMVQMEPDDLRRKYELPKPMIEYYSSSKDFFLKARGIRDRIYHYRPADENAIRSIVLCDEAGFALSRNNIFPDMMSSAFDIWPTSKVKPSDLVSVLALESYVTRQTMRATEEFTRALMASIVPLAPISLSHKLFLRSPYAPHLVRLERYLEEQWVEGEISYGIILTGDARTSKQKPTWKIALLQLPFRWWAKLRARLAKRRELGSQKGRAPKVSFWADLL
jgi:hypothetical protein